ncbi:hypothetical protein EV131_1372 [Rhizobium laguerreae]|uniref:Transposase n=1 Tax=Rhizobium laguerreae TaxID=1076926 RepID=A0AAX2QA33_9HYPH|nr:hypothetical protein EV131_1372 [Rhizobium laguerreae]
MMMLRLKRLRNSLSEVPGMVLESRLLWLSD